MIRTELAMKLENAISFLVHAMNNSGHNTKPVILHSILVGIRLAKHNYADDIVVAGFLHDVLEDSDIEAAELEKEFGSKVSRLVENCTYNFDIPDKIQQYTTAIDKAYDNGKDALIIMAADFIENEPFYNQANKAIYPRDKIKYFINKTQDLLHNEAIRQDMLPILKKLEE